MRRIGRRRRRQSELLKWAEADVQERKVMAWQAAAVVMIGGALFRFTRGEGDDNRNCSSDKKRRAVP
jgi:hypothetical protein